MLQCDTADCFWLIIDFFIFFLFLVNSNNAAFELFVTFSQLGKMLLRFVIGVRGTKVFLEWIFKTYVIKQIECFSKRKYFVTLIYWSLDKWYFKCLQSFIFNMI